jgi:hypothetical protein
MILLLYLVLYGMMPWCTCYSRACCWWYTCYCRAWCLCYTGYMAWYTWCEFWNRLNPVSSTVSIKLCWTNGCRIFHRSAWMKEFLALYGVKGWLLCSQEPAMCPYPQLYPSSSHFAILHVCIQNFVWFVTCDKNTRTVVESSILFLGGNQHIAHREQ